jgi:hypothetical protein
MKSDFIPLPFDIDEIFEIDEKRFVVLDYRRASNWTDWERGCLYRMRAENNLAYHYCTF